MIVKLIGIVLISVIQFIYLVGCATKEVKAPVAEVKQISCTFNQFDGECKYFDNGTTLCSTGTCSEGNCITGKGVLTYPGGSKLEGIFKDGKLNGVGSYQGCSESYVGTFKNDFKDKGIFVSNESNKIFEGTFKDELKTGNFNVYLDYNKQFPFVENGKVLVGVYSKKIAIQFIKDRDKIEYEREEAERKRIQRDEELLQKERENEIKDLRKLLKEREEERLREEVEYRRKEEIENRKREKERLEEEKRVRAREKEYEIEEKAKNDCIESRYKYSNECKNFEKKYNYNPIKEN